MESKLGTVFKTIQTYGCYRHVRRERLLGEVRAEELTHPGLAGFPTSSTLHPCDLPGRRGTPPGHAG